MKNLPKGWLEDHLSTQEDVSIRNEKKLNPEQTLYHAIQPSGLMYGEATGVSHLQVKKSEKLKVVLAEKLVYSSRLFSGEGEHADKAQAVAEAAEQIRTFYNQVFPEYKSSERTLIGRKRPVMEQVENIIANRVNSAQVQPDNFWSQFFQNSLLFLDVFIFGQWINARAENIVSDFFKYEKEELVLTVVQIIIAASHANNQVDVEEKRLLEFFLMGSQLSNEKKKEAMRLLERGVYIEDIHFPMNHSWLLKKYFLELAILTMWADKNVEESEQVFLKKLTDKLGLTENELESSHLAVEGFIVQYWDELDLLQEKNKYQQVSQQYIIRLANITQQNRNTILKEAEKEKELLQYINMMHSHEMTEEQKDAARELILPLLTKIPAFVITSLPANFLTWSVLEKIFPPAYFEKSA